MSYVIVAKGTGLIVTDGPNKTRAYKTWGAAKAHVHLQRRRQEGMR